MFEGYAGSVILFETLNHFMIEQIYITRIFELIEKSPNFFDERNVWGPNFYTRFGIGDCQLECTYVQIYFWNVISAQHCSLLENISNGVFGVRLSREVEKVLEQLNNEYCHIIQLLGCYKYDTAKIVKQFLMVNARFIKVLNRIMFEEYLGSTELFEVVNNFMIEQIYAARVFVDKKRSPQYKAKRSVLGPDFYEKEGLGESKLEIAYNTFYFWNS